MKDPFLAKMSEDISNILENVWNIGRLTQEESDTFDKCIDSPAGRKLFRGQLNKYRISHRKVVNDKSFKTLKALIWKVLNKMKKIDDSKSESEDDSNVIRKPSFIDDQERERIETCMDCMIMSETFCKKLGYGSDDSKLFLQSEIKYHSIWQDNENYWRGIIIHSIREEINSNNVSADDLDDLLNEDDVMKTVETKLNWFVHDMISYEINLSSIENIIKSIALMYCLPEVSTTQILLFAKSKWEERLEYGFSDQVNEGAALNEVSINESILIEKEIEQDSEEAKLKLEEEKSMQGDNQYKIRTKLIGMPILFCHLCESL